MSLWARHCSSRKVKPGQRIKRQCKLQTQTHKLGSVMSHSWIPTLTIAVRAVFCIAGSVLNSFTLTVFASVLGHRVVTFPKRVLHTTTTGTWALAPRSPSSPSTIDWDLWRPEAETVRHLTSRHLDSNVNSAPNGPYLIIGCFFAAQTLACHTVAVMATWSSISPWKVFGLAHK